MNKTAYLVGFIDTKAGPPKYLGCAIFSEPGPSTGSQFPFVILEASGETYDGAVNALRRTLAANPAFAWAKPLHPPR